MGRVQLDRPALQRLQDSAREADDRQRARSGRPLGTPTPVQKATYAAKLGDLVVCVPPAAGQLITLPAIETRDAGRPVTVYNKSGNAYTITIRTPAGVTIDGAASTTLSLAWGRAICVVLSATEWGVM